jgi:hypothetical protein
MARAKKELDPQPSPTDVEPEVRGSPFDPSENKVYQNIRTVLVTARQKAYAAINFAMVEAYWKIGRQIMEAQEGQRAEYGTGLIKYLAERLTKEFGKGFTETNIRYMRQFYATFPIRHALRDELSWTHYRLLMRIDNEPSSLSDLGQVQLI